ncbi:hypothetical protein YC2023_069741 [Brassica napus]
MDYQLVRRNEEETKKMFTMFLLHLLLSQSRRTIRWTTATMAATKRNTTVRSCRDVTITAVHHIRLELVYFSQQPSAKKSSPIIEGLM